MNILFIFLIIIVTIFLWKLLTNSSKSRDNFTEDEAKIIATYFGVDLNVIPLKVWTFGLNVELEHGKKLGPVANVTQDNAYATAQIVLAHLLEYSDYYERLYEMEKSADEYWKNKIKPNIFLQKK